ncbi:hypothetical protein [Streptomyces cavernicola]|uniref:Uncharacterized protein n=1 Tax=Streptomyces cavernicola TaxID=3043613 RepID=A0ABT6SJF8_9ACTN|nr:hypothetical protein [Streptomyces sp. B-S-A6]MDI3408328.1 hypothetical protein [Streptomyces sp. B-S-A6]
MTSTAEIIERYADDIAAVAAEAPVTDLDTFIDHVDTAARQLEIAGINGHEDIESAVGYLSDARNSDDDAARTAFLNRADELLKFIWDMADEYSDMV